MHTEIHVSINHSKGGLSVKFGDVAQIHLGAPMVHYPEVEVLAVMNVNLAQKPSRFKGMLSVKFSKCESAQKASKGLYW